MVTGTWRGFLGLELKEGRKVTIFMNFPTCKYETQTLQWPSACLRMASALSHHFLCTQSMQANPLLKSQMLTTKPHYYARLRVVSKSSPEKNSNTSLESSSPKPTPPQDSSSINSVSLLLRRFRYCVQSKFAFELEFD